MENSVQCSLILSSKNVGWYVSPTFISPPQTTLYIHSPWVRKNKIEKKEREQCMCWNQGFFFQ